VLQIADDLFLMYHLDDVFDNEHVQIDFKPLYQSILIYTALDILEELQRSYQADRKTQSTLILSSQLSLQSLPDLTEEITGFFIAESHVLQNTRGFRSQREVDELWDGVIERLKTSVASELETERDPAIFLKVKECLLSFTMNMEVSEIVMFSTNYLPFGKGLWLRLPFTP
jgi:exocyst complex component 6